jgi:hypothetical protein
MSSMLSPTVDQNVPSTGRVCAPVRSAHGLDSFVGLLSVDGTLLQANRMPSHLEHLSAQDALGGPLWRARWWAWSPAAQDRVRDAVELGAGGEVCRYRETLRLARGELVEFDFTVVPQCAGDVVSCLVFSAVDVTPRSAAPARRVPGRRPPG